VLAPSEGERLPVVHLQPVAGHSSRRPRIFLLDGDRRDLADPDAQPVKELRNFLGGRAAGRALRAYERSLASSGPLYRAYYIEKRHPWWHDWLIYNQKEREGRSLANRFSPGVQKIAADAHKIAVLQRDMPEPVKKKYRRIRPLRTFSNWKLRGTTGSSDAQ
jgi:hypothetical protein